MVGVVKYAGAPLGDYGSAGVNVTSKKCLPEKWQRGPLAALVNALGMLQSILRYTLIPLILIGVYYGFRAHKQASVVLMVTVVYYWFVNSLMHTNIRYGLPMHAIFAVFAGVTIFRLYELASKWWPIWSRKHSPFKA